MRQLFDWAGASAFGLSSEDFVLPRPTLDVATIPGTPNIGQGATIPTDLGEGVFAIGDRIFVDRDGNGLFDQGVDGGIGGVVVSLYRDFDGDGVADGVAIATSTTCNCGIYGFSGLAAGNYVVVIGSANFNGALAGYASLTAIATPDGGVQSASIAFGGLGSASNLTVDFGFVEGQSLVSTTSAETYVNEGGQTCTFNEDDGIWICEGGGGGGGGGGGFWNAILPTLTEDTPSLVTIYDVFQGNAITADFLAFDFTDGGGGSVFFCVDGVPTYGQVSVADIQAGRVTIQPAPNVSGPGAGSDVRLYYVDSASGTRVSRLIGWGNGGGITILAANDAPVGTDAIATLSEDGVHVFAIADFGFSDPVEGDAFAGVFITTVPAAGTLSLDGVPVSADQYVTAADIAAGLLTFTPAADANGSGYASFTFQVRDTGGTANGGVDTDPIPRSVTFDVTPIPDAPEGSDATVSLSRNGTHVFSAADFGFSDVDGDGFGSVTIATLPAAGTLTLDGEAVTAGQSIDAGEIAAGRLVFTPVTGAHGAGYASLTFQVRDNSGSAGADLDATPNTLTFDVVYVNAAPSGADATLSLDEDGVHIFSQADFGFDDGDGGDPFAAVRIATLPEAGSLTLAGEPVTLGQIVTAAAIASGGLVFTPAANGNGGSYASFTFQVQDGGGTGFGGADLDPTPNTITLEVLPVNDAPSGADTSVTLAEDGEHVFTAADFGFSDPDGDSFAGMTIATLPTAGSLTLGGAPVSAGQFVTAAQIASGALVFVPAPDANGAGHAGFSFRVHDDGGTDRGGIDTEAGTHAITLDVTAAPDAPLSADVSRTILEDAAYTFDFADFAFDDIDGDAFAGIVISELPAAGSLALDGEAVTLGQFVSAADIAAGALVFVPPSNGNGAGLAGFRFQVRDDSGATGADTSIAQAFTFDVTPVNDAPSGSDSTVTLLEDGAHVFALADFGFADLDGDTLAAVIVAGLPGAGALTLDGVSVTEGQVLDPADIAAGLLVFTPSADANGSAYASLTFQLQDDGGTANGGIDLDPTPRTVTFDVVPVNDAPWGADAGIAIDEDTPYAFALADFGFSDPDGDAFAGIEIDSLPVAGALMLDGEIVSAGQFVTAADIAAGLLAFAPAANANGAGHASLTFRVRDEGGTANGGVDQDLVARTLSFDVAAVDDAPLAQADTATTTEAATVTISVLGNDTDVDEGPIGVVQINGAAITAGETVTIASGATVTLNANGTLTYNPNGRFDYLVSAATATATGSQNSSAIDSFTYGLNGGATASVAVTVTGLSGSGDQLRGSAGSDVLTSPGSASLFMLDGGGADSATGGAGNDGFFFGTQLDADDRVDGGAGPDNQVAIQGNYLGGGRLVLGAETFLRVQTLSILSGSVTRFGDTGASLYSYDITMADGNVTSGATMTINANTLLPGENLTFNGAAETHGSFFVYAGRGDDALTGSQNSDAFFFGADARFSAADRVDGQGGADDQLSLRGDYSAQIVFQATTMTNIETLVLMSASDVRFAPGGTAFSYNIRLHDANVGAGQTLTVSANALQAGESVTFDGSGEHDGAFLFLMGRGNDVLIGGDGNDRFYGRDGQDVMTGGAGNDTFYFRALSESTASAMDHVTDFADGDRIDMSYIDANTTRSGNQAFAFIGDAAFTNTAGELRVSGDGTDWTVEVDVNGDGIADMAIHVSTPGGHGFVAGDFIL